MTERFLASAQLKAIRERSGRSMADVAKDCGYKGASSYQRYESSDLFTKKYLPLELVEKLIPALVGRGVPPITETEITQLAGPSLKKSSNSRLIPVVGYVGAGAEIFSVDDHEKGGGMDEVEVPIDGMKPSTVAVIVRGDSMMPVYRPNDLIFYDTTHNGDLIHLIGKDCVIRLSDGRTFLKELQIANGTYWLHSYNAPPMVNVKIEWAAKVEVVKRA